MASLLDTNVLSELRKPKPEPAVVTFVSSCPLGELYISSVTLDEIRFGIELVLEPSQGIEPRNAHRSGRRCRYQVQKATRTPAELISERSL
jgi:predicted nucleic acid-binding protein